MYAIDADQGPYINIESHDNGGSTEVDMHELHSWETEVHHKGYPTTSFPWLLCNL